VVLPWARPGSGFTLLFEALLAQMPVKAVACLVGEHDTRLWRLLHHHVERARATLDLGEVSRVGVDAARVNFSEADSFGNYCVVAVSCFGSLIQTAVGRAGGAGGLRTNRSGWAA
jgi:hypothetical protein